MTDQQRKHLSEHFTLYELVRSGMAIERDIDNMPNLKQEQSLRLLAQNVLEPLRRQFGPIVISSGFRTPRLNLMVGGVAGSQHTKGEAADIVLPDADTGRRMYAFVKARVDFDQLIWEPIGAPVPRWLHVSYTARLPSPFHRVNVFQALVQGRHSFVVYKSHSRRYGLVCV